MPAKRKPRAKLHLSKKQKKDDGHNEVETSEQQDKQEQIKNMVTEQVNVAMEETRASHKLLADLLTDMKKQFFPSIMEYIAASSKVNANDISELKSQVDSLRQLLNQRAQPDLHVHQEVDEPKSPVILPLRDYHFDGDDHEIKKDEPDPIPAVDSECWVCAMPFRYLPERLRVERTILSCSNLKRRWEYIPTFNVQGCECVPTHCNWTSVIQEEHRLYGCKLEIKFIG
jgi:hypothetical protein